MKAYKNGADLTFICDDGKTVKYNLNTHECIGKNGKPCKYLNSQLKGYTVDEIANSFEDKNFGKFINYVAIKASNTSYPLLNIGTVFQRLYMFQNAEQIYSAGLNLMSPRTGPYKGTINEIPNGLVKILRKTGIAVDNIVIEEYKKHPDAFNYAFNSNFISISPRQAIEVLLNVSREYSYKENKYVNKNLFFELCDEFGYTTKSLLNYLDYLVTYEAIDSSSSCYRILRDIKDNCKMLSEMSDKYDKYPRHFLSSHRITSRTYERWKQECNEELFAKRVNPKMETTIGNYKFIYPKTTNDIKQEAVMQSNCVASYIDSVIDGRCNIILMRDKNDVENSLVTVEVRGGKVVQARQRFNEVVTENQQKALDKYEEFLSKLN